MIKENELRIWNLAYDAKMKSPIQILSINFYGVKMAYSWNRDFNERGRNGGGIFLEYKYIEGIPLTEEWLVKFDFLFEDKTASRLKLDTEFGEVLIRLKDLSANCKYVHELQNIYFALYKKELELKK